jgi:hypothetical protein
LNDILSSSGRERISGDVLTDVDAWHLKEYLEDCLTFERYDLYEANSYDLGHIEIEGEFFARSVTMNYRQILYDVVALSR